jgi:hypothetical protein
LLSHQNMNASTKERSLPELFSDVTRESADLVRKEIELAKLEVTEGITALKSGALQMLLALPLLLGGFLVLLAAAVFGLDTQLQRPWLSALVVGIAVLLGGGVALLVGRSQLDKKDILPDRSIASLREDKEMLQEHVGS